MMQGIVYVDLSEYSGLMVDDVFSPRPHMYASHVVCERKADFIRAITSVEAECADVPRCVLEGSPKVRRLFPDYEAVERDYYRRTGIFPIMHAVVVTRELAEREPDIVQAVYRGFCNAKAAMAEELEHGMTFNNMAVVDWPARARPRASRYRSVALRHGCEPRGYQRRAALPSRAEPDGPPLHGRGNLRSLPPPHITERCMIRSDIGYGCLSRHFRMSGRSAAPQKRVAATDA
jgi:hypothetical protein